MRDAVVKQPSMAPSFFLLAVLDGLSYNEKTRKGGPDGTVAASIQSFPKTPRPRFRTLPTRETHTHTHTLSLSLSWERVFFLREDDGSRSLAERTARLAPRFQKLSRRTSKNTGLFFSVCFFLLNSPLDEKKEKMKRRSKLVLAFPKRLESAKYEGFVFCFLARAFLCADFRAPSTRLCGRLWTCCRSRSRR